MNRNFPARQAVLMQQAERLLRDEGFLHLPVDIEGLARTRGIIVQPMVDSDEGVSGMLVRHGNNFGIRYSTSFRNEGFQRFSISHELGHYFIEGHLDHITFVEGRHRSHSGFVSVDRHEREADYFAAGLLMPATLVRNIIHRTPDGLEAVEAIRNEARASLVASAIRYAGLAEAATAAIVSHIGKIDYCFISGALRSMNPAIYPRKGTPVPPGTVTEFMTKHPSERRPGAHTTEDIDGSLWIGGTSHPQAREEVVALGSYGRILTLLTLPEFLDEGLMEEDEASEEALAESWTPAFRR